MLEEKAFIEHTYSPWGRYMRTIMVLAVAFMLCSLCFAMNQDVGGDYGKSWLIKYSNKFVSNKGSINSRTDDLWKWGGKPLGYEVFNNTLHPMLAPTEWYYPAFMTNTTPIVINGTALLKNRDFMPIDFLFPDFASDPWSIAQATERPVMVRYPAVFGRGTLQ